MFHKKHKRLLKSSRSLISLGIPTNAAVGPLGFRAELDIGPKGEQYRICRDMRADRPDSAVTLDEDDPRTSRIVFFDKESEDQGPSAPGTSTRGVVIDSVEPGNGSTSECFCSLLLWSMFTQISIPLPSEENTDDTREEEENTGDAGGVEENIGDANVAEVVIGDAGVAEENDGDTGKEEENTGDTREEEENAGDTREEEENTGDTIGGGGEPTMTSGGTCRCRSVIRFPLIPTSSRESPERLGTRSCCHLR